MTSLQIPTDEQEEDERGDRIEVDLAAAGQDSPDTPGEPGRDADADGEVHVRGPRTHRRQCSPKEERTREERGDAHEQAGAVEESAHSGRSGGSAGHLRASFTVEREGHQHDVPSGCPRDAHANDEPTQQGPVSLLGPETSQGARLVAKLGEGPRDLRQGGAASGRGFLGARGMPLELQAGPAEVQASRADRRLQTRQPLHQPDTSGAVDALEADLGSLRSIWQARAVELPETGCVELLELAVRYVDAGAGRSQARAEVVVLSEPRVRQEDIHLPATSAAELELRPSPHL